jgi:hypothetical protein
MSRWSSASVPTFSRADQRLAKSGRGEPDDAEIYERRGTWRAPLLSVELLGGGVLLPPVGEDDITAVLLLNDPPVTASHPVASQQNVAFFIDTYRETALRFHGALLGAGRLLDRRKEMAQRNASRIVIVDNFAC